MAEAGHSPAEYVTHHLHHWATGHDAAFITAAAWHLDTLLISTVLGLIFLTVFRIAAVRATSAVPGGKLAPPRFIQWRMKLHRR